jgi:hypothetical protein
MKREKRETTVLKPYGAIAALVMMVSAAAAPEAAAQPPRPPSPAPAAAQRDEQVQARYNIFVMEGVLERAVAHGADQLRRQMQRVAPDLQLLTGDAQARGFRLDGYGVFFDVGVPVMRQSVLWTWRTMFYDNAPAGTTLQQLKASIDRIVLDPREKATLMQMLKRVEAQVGAPAGPPGSAATPMVAARPSNERAVPANERTVQAMEAPQPIAPTLAPEEAALLDDPNGAYEREVVNALIETMLVHGGSISIGPDEWLTVAAHDTEHRSRLAGQPYDLMTIVLRVKGSDLAALRAERITLEEARKRVEVREF